MSIETTIEISRKQALYRIKKIHMLAKNKNFVTLEALTNESDYGLEEFVRNYDNVEYDQIDNYTNFMLEERMDAPFFRFSTFENYSIVDWGHIMIDGYTKEELKWVKGLRSERAEGFASTCVELSRKFEIDKDSVLYLVNEHFWSVWDTDAYIRGLVKNNYPLRELTKEK